MVEPTYSFFIPHEYSCLIAFEMTGAYIPHTFRIVARCQQQGDSNEWIVLSTAIDES
jgi:hypothetical protein